MIEVSELHIYPIKSCAGIQLRGVRFDDRGAQYDRRWMLVDDSGEMITQRTHPRCILARPSMLPTALQIEGPSLPPLKLPLTASGKRRRAVIWQHETEALDQGDEAAEWFTELLGSPARLVRWADDQVRTVSKRHSDLDSQIAFCDGYPVLLISEASLRDLNDRLEQGQRLTMARFRPNIVVKNCLPYAEDEWAELHIGSLGVTLVKPCDRCSIPTVDPQTGIAGAVNPLKTLATYRRQGSTVVFGQNGIHHGFGMLRVGDPVEIRSKRP